MLGHIVDGVVFRQQFAGGRAMDEVPTRSGQLSRPTGVTSFNSTQSMPNEWRLRVVEFFVTFRDALSPVRPYWCGKDGWECDDDICGAIEIVPAASGEDWHGDVELYSVCIEYIRHENELTNHRTNWFLFSQAIIAAAVGYVFSKQSGPFIASIMADNLHFNFNILLISILWFLISLTGLVTAASARDSIDAAHRAKYSIDRLWRKAAHPTSVAKLPNMMGGKLVQIADTGSGFANDLPTLAWAAWGLSAVTPIVFIVGKVLASALFGW